MKSSIIKPTAEQNTTETIHHLPLATLIPNPYNPRRNFSGPKFDALVLSIKAAGILQPIMVRPIKDAAIYGDSTHEVIFGGRRFAACRKAAEENGGIQDATIPARIREMDDNTALDLMTIENLQRDDLTPMEEAHGFKTYVDRQPDPDAAVVALSENTGIRSQYIRRRLALFKLPKKIITAWEKGAVKYTHLRQFLRIYQSKKLLAEVFEDATRYNYNAERTARTIDQKTPPLKWARFDMDKSGCDTCPHNSNVQNEQLGIDGPKSICMNRPCFKRHQNKALQAAWKRSGYRRKHKTTGFRFEDDFSYNDYNHFYDKTATDKCRTCEHFVTLLYLEGKASEPYACLGTSTCFNATARSGNNQPGGGQTQTQLSLYLDDCPDTKPDPLEKPAEYLETPRVSWHGEHFREEFYKEAIPEKFDDLAPNRLEVLHLALYALVENNEDVKKWFATRHGLGKEGTYGYWDYARPKKLLAHITAMDYTQVTEEIKDATCQSVLSGHHTGTTRRRMTDHIGIDLKEQWRLNDAYLQKKTKAELMALGEHLEVFTDPAAQAFLFEKLMKKRGKFTTCKKPELISVFLESGVDLAGKVPPEILAKS